MKKTLLISACCFAFGIANAETNIGAPLESADLHSKIEFFQKQAEIGTQQLPDSVKHGNSLNLEEPAVFEEVSKLSSLEQASIALKEVHDAYSKDITDPSSYKIGQEGLIQLLKMTIKNVQSNGASVETVKELRAVLNKVKAANFIYARTNRNVIVKIVEEITGKLSDIMTKGESIGKVDKGIFEEK